MYPVTESWFDSIIDPLMISAVCNSKNWNPSYRKGGLLNGLCRQRLAPPVLFWTGCSTGARTQGSSFCWRLEPKVRNTTI